MALHQKECSNTDPYNEDKGYYQHIFATFLWQSKATAGHAMQYEFCVPFSISHLVKPACF